MDRKCLSEMCLWLVCSLLSVGGKLSAADLLPPLTVPGAPKIEIRGAPGKATLYYWAWAADARGHSAYSPVAIVSNAPEKLSGQNAIIITPAPVSNATQYAVLSTRCAAPTDLKIEVKAKGERTFYYWLQAGGGRTALSPITGPFKAEGCAETPSNQLTWASSGAMCYYVYRTIAPEPPLGSRSCVIRAWFEGTSLLDCYAVPGTRFVNSAGNPADKPEGAGMYLLGSSKGEPVVDEGQPLALTTAYDLNTTDPAYNPHKPVVKGITPGVDGSVFHQGAYQFDSCNRLVMATPTWNHYEGISVNQNNEQGGMNIGQGGLFKNSHVGIAVHQNNYTSSQKSGILEYIHNFGNGDCVAQVVSINTSGQTRTDGDEGAEFFSYHMGRNLARDLTRVLTNARPGNIFLKLEKPGKICADRGIVNLSQVHTTGLARVVGNVTNVENSVRVRGDVCAVGEGTDWQPNMEGWAISFDADTRPDGIRQWFKIDRYISPTRLKIFAYTFYSTGDCYLGNAHTNGHYLLCPYTEMQDGPAGDGVRVAALATAWNKDDKVEVIAGPQTAFRLGWWEMKGNMLPQDHVGGLGIIYNGDKMAGEGAFNIMGNWPEAMEVHGTRAGLLLENVNIGVIMNTNCPIVLRVVGENETPLYQVSRDAQGLYLESTNTADPRVVGLTLSGLALHQGTLSGNERTRGTAVFSGDGKTTEFVVKFASAYAAAPFVVASSNQRVGMGVEKAGPEGFTAAFAAPPPAGKDNVVVTWMVQE